MEVKEREKIKLFINIVFWIILSSSTVVFSQVNPVVSSISDCVGAVEIEVNREIQLHIPVVKDEVEDLKAYAQDLKLPETNSLWFKFESAHSGWFKLGIETIDFPVEYGVFILADGQNCSAIVEGSAVLFSSGLIDEKSSKIMTDSLLYVENQMVYFFVNAMTSSKNGVVIQTHFAELINEETAAPLKKTYDFRSSKNEEPLHIMIRDAKTKQPVEANVIVTGSKTYNALYSASDLIFSYSSNMKMMLKVDANGYFFQDLEIDTKKDKQKEYIVDLIRLEQNQLIELEGLVFEPQSDRLIIDAIPKLKRLKDFMTLNDEINIEIQGHVHLEGKNSLKAKRLSKKRAKRVMKYLVESGIDKKRISVVGYGNSKMRFPEAISEDEKQANRRVEIKIK